MYRFFVFLLLVFFAQASAAQSVQELHRRIDSLYTAGYNGEVVELGKQLNSQVATIGLRDTLAYVRSMIKLSDALKMKEAAKESGDLLEAIEPLAMAYPLEFGKWLCEYGHLKSYEGDYYLADSLTTTGINLILQSDGENTLAHVRGIYLSGRIYAAAFDPGADSLFENCLQRWEQAKLPIHWQLGQIYASMAAWKHSVGDAQASVFHAKKGLEIFSNYPPGFTTAFRLKRTYAAILIAERDMSTAEQIIEQLKKDAVGAFGENSQEYASALERAYEFQMDMGRLNEGLQSASEAMRIKKSLKVPILIQVLADDMVADALIELDRKDEARAIHQAILDSLMTLKKRNKHYEGHAWEGLARCEADPEKAIPMFQTAISLFQVSLGRQDCGIDAYVISLLAEQYLAADRPEDALRTISLLNPDTSFAGKNSPQLMEFLRFRGILLSLTGQHEAALTDWTQLAQTWRDIISSELFLGNAFQRLEQIPALRKISEVLLVHAAQPGASGNLTTLALDFQLFTKSLLLSADQRVRQNIQSDPSLAPVFKEWTDARERLAWCYTQPSAELNAQKIDLSALKARVDSLEKQIARNSAGFAAESLRKPYSWTDVRNQLRPGEASIEIARYFEYGPNSNNISRYALFIIRPEMHEKPAVVFLPDGERLDQILLEKYLSECANPQGKGQTGDLYEAFWKKIEPYLKDITRLYVSADGAFFKINLGAIQFPNGQYLADRYDVRNVFSLKDIGLPEDQVKVQSASKTAYLAGNPTFLLKNESDVAAVTLRSVSETPDSIAKNDPFESLLRNADETRGLSLSPLPGSEQEVNDIAVLLRKKGWETTVATGLSAKEDAVKAVQSPTVLHLATHGYFLANVRSGTAGLSRSVLENNPMLRSMIFFAGAQNTLDKKPLGNEDGILTAYEAQNLHLEGTELVVLSACQTAQGKIQNGEGVYGLQRALRIAGAKAVLLSLWDVDDKVGREFMTAFYAKWLGGMGKSEAFRAAQLEIKKKHAQPFYWAGFVLIGG